MSSLVEIFISLAPENGFAILEHNLVEENKWYLRASFSIRLLCESEADIYLIRNDDVLYSVTTATCPQWAAKWKEAFDVFHSSFDYW